MTGPQFDVPVPGNRTVTVTLTGDALVWLQAAVANAGPTTIVRLAVDTEADQAEGIRGIQTVRFQVNGGSWSPPAYADAVTAVLYEGEES